MTRLTKSSPRPRIVTWLPALVAESTCGMCLEALERRGIVSRHDHRPLRAVSAHQLAWRADIDDPAVVDDGDAVAQALRLFHQVCGQEDGLAALADAAHEVPDRASRLRVESGRQLVEEHDLGIVDERERDEQPLLLTARQRHEPGVALIAQAELLEQAITVERRAVERRPELDRFPHLDALLELRLLQLDADPFLQRVGLTDGIQAEDGDGAAIRRPEPFDAFHRRRLAGAVGADQAENLSRLHVECDLVDRDRPAVSLANPGHVDHGVLGHPVPSDTGAASSCVKQYRRMAS